MNSKNLKGEEIVEKETNYEDENENEPTRVIEKEKSIGFEKAINTEEVAIRQLLEELGQYDKIKSSRTGKARASPAGLKSLKRETSSRVTTASESIEHGAYRATTSNTLFRISDIDLQQEKTNKWKKRIRKSLKIKTKMTAQELGYSCKKIYNFCLKRIKDLHELHLKRVEAMEILQDIIERADLSEISTTRVVHLIWSIMSCIHHFQLRFRSGTSIFVTWTRRKMAQSCMKTYSDLISRLRKPMYRVVLNALLVFYKEGKLWTIEFDLTEMICNLLYIYDDIEEALEYILVTAEHASLAHELDARMLIKVLYEVLAKIKWSHMSESMMMRFLVMLRKSIYPNAEHIYNYVPMRRGLNICLKNITQNLNNKNLMTLLIILTKKITRRDMDEELLLEFGNVVEYAAINYKTQRFQSSFPDELMKNIFTMLGSENELHNLFGCRVLQDLMDRQKNGSQFEVPCIFYEDACYNITVAKFSVRDKSFFKKYRNVFHNVMLATLKNHYTRRINLENIFSLLAIIAVEIPCAYTASSIVCYAMSMQELVLSQPNTTINNESNHHVHAIAMSLMSLVCYVHKAEIFYDYITIIMERRSELAPHLNPPLKATYNYAQHHILWNKPELFFEDWEARYGLWKCFRSTNKRKPKNDLKKLK